MLDLLVATDLVRRQSQESLAPKAPKPDARRRPPQTRRPGIRSTSAAALRGLADLVEPSPTG